MFQVMKISKLVMESKTHINNNSINSETYVIITEEPKEVKKTMVTQTIVKIMIRPLLVQLKRATV